MDGATVRGLDGRDVRSDWEQPSSTEDLVLFYDKAARCGAAVRGHFHFSRRLRELSPVSPVYLVETPSYTYG